MRYYFDYAAATPVAPEVEKAMKPYWSEVFGNPGALHWFGQGASAAVFKARDAIAKSLGCSYREIVFTGSATEANNLAIRGVLRGMMNNELRIKEKEKFIIHDSKFIIPKIIVSSIEHDSVLDTARDLEKEGVEVVYVPVDKNGLVNLKKLESALDERTVLVSVMYANNEIGTIQPIAEISQIVRNFRNSKTAYPLFHCDAVQAFNYLNCNVNDLGVDLMTLSSQKIYGPKGVGLLYVKRNSKHEARSTKQIQNSKLKIQNVSDFGFRISDLQLVTPIVTGGGQEYSLRAGTENVPGIVGFAKAIELADKMRDKEVKRLRKLQEYFVARMETMISKLQLNGDFKNRLPNNINMYIPRTEGQDLIVKLDLAGFAVSPGAACSARTCSPSHVLKALGHSDERATHSIRITFGRYTDRKEIDLLIKAAGRLVL